MIEEFTYQVRLAKVMGVFESPPEKWIKFLKAHQYFILFIQTFSIIVFCPRPNYHILVITENLADLVTTVLSNLKYMFFLISAKKCFQLMHEVKDLNKKWKFKELHSFIDKANKMDRFVFMTMFLACCSATTGYCTAPMIKNLITYFFMDQPFPYEMPLNATYYVEYKYFPLYQILYLSQGYNSILSGMQNVVVDTFFFGSCINICAHFEILRNIINEINVKEFVDYHQKTLELATKLNKIFGIVIFGEYLILSVIFCVIGFQVVISEDLIHSVPMMFHGTAALINLLIYSYGGEIIMDHANKVCEDCYKINKDYLIVMMRTKHEYKVESMMYHASLPTFSLIMGRTMSMITLLESFI
ncbi:unnamed protein product [Chironomus riparius]|uniref:Odorant receptor n=1 Tax=Chironomus riparius TaxID=315576 RepID=A0A9N9WQZ5_9DIPT|nr:unnamed protein product [Chironomus riparius]